MIRLKHVTILLCPWICMSCQKQEKFESLPEYEKLIGKWKSIDGDLNGQLIIKKKGKIIVHYGVERGERFQASRIFLNKYTYNYYGKNWRSIEMEKVNHKDEYLYGNAILFNTTFDTVLKFSGEFNTEQLSKESFVRYIRK